MNHFKLPVLKYVVLAGVFLLWVSALVKSADRRGEMQDLLAFSLTLVISVIFSPIAWTHYLLFFILPYLVLLHSLIQRGKISSRMLILGGLAVSYLFAALPASYPLLLLNFPILNKVPVTLLSSTGFIGGILLVVIIIFHPAFPEAKVSRGRFS